MQDRSRMITLDVKLPDCARFSTICIHAGQQPVDPSTGAIITTDLFQTATYVQDELGVHKGTWTPGDARAPRSGSNIIRGHRRRQGRLPTRGMAAIGGDRQHAPRRRSRGRHRQHMRRTFRLFDKVLTKCNTRVLVMDMASRLELVEEAIRRNENAVRQDADEPGPELTDLARTAELAASATRAIGGRQYLCQPVRAAAHRVRRRHGHPQHDRGLNGHSDSIGGIVAVRDGTSVAEVRAERRRHLPPFHSWPFFAAPKTLAVRMAQHNTNGMALAEFLQSHPKVKQVIYPGLPAPAA